ncbi:MAG: FeoA domain-containing protein [Methanophagales archaeon]|nr:FeoA domain-containing protein [Methanophagales archaeon]
MRRQDGKDGGLLQRRIMDMGIVRGAEIEMVRDFFSLFFR